MHAKLFASLQETIEKWVQKHSQDDEFNPQVAWFPEDLELNMTKAAALIFDAQLAASAEAEKETSS